MFFPQYFSDDLSLFANFCHFMACREASANLGLNTQRAAPTQVHSRGRTPLSSPPLVAPAASPRCHPGDCADLGRLWQPRQAPGAGARGAPQGCRQPAEGPGRSAGTHGARLCAKPALRSSISGHHPCRRLHPQGATPACGPGRSHSLAFFFGTALCPPMESSVYSLFTSTHA